jgi:hypothetical protein
MHREVLGCLSPSVSVATPRRLITTTAFVPGVLPLRVAHYADSERSGDYELPKYSPDCR